MEEPLADVPCTAGASQDVLGRQKQSKQSIKVPEALQRGSEQRQQAKATIMQAFAAPLKPILAQGP